MPIFEVKSKSEVAKLVRFSTGKLNPDAKDTVEFKSFYVKEDRKTPHKRKLVVTSEVQGIKYSGQNYGSSNHFSTDKCDYYVAVHRKGKEKVQVLPAELFLMQPQFKDTEVTESQDQEEKSYKTKRYDLIKQFGSGQLQRKVNKLLVASYENDMVTSTTDSAAKNFTLTQQASTSEEAQPVDGGGGKQAEIEQSSVVPPHNKDATSPEDVYALETIIPSWVMEALMEQSQVFVTCTSETIAQWREKKEYSEIILSLLEKLPADDDERQEECPSIMYLHCLLHNYMIKAHEFRTKTKTYPESWKGLVKKLLDENFITETISTNQRKSRCRPNALKGLLLSHILILYMRICNYSISLKPLVVQLKLNMKTLIQHAKLLGFSIRTETSGLFGESTTAILTVPLTFPVKRKPLTKKRGRIF